MEFRLPEPPTLPPRQETLLAALHASDGELSGQELHARLRGGTGAMGLATVYRHLRLLQQRGLVRCRHLPSGEALYAPTERGTGARHRHIAALTGRQGEAQPRPRQRTEQRVGRQPPQPEAARAQPAGGGGDQHADQQEGQGFDQQALEQGPGGGQAGKGHQRARPRSCSCRVRQVSSSGWLAFARTVGSN